MYFSPVIADINVCNLINFRNKYKQLLIKTYHNLKDGEVYPSISSHCMSGTIFDKMQTDAPAQWPSYRMHHKPNMFYTIRPLYVLPIDGKINIQTGFNLFVTRQQCAADVCCSSHQPSLLAMTNIYFIWKENILDMNLSSHILPHRTWNNITGWPHSNAQLMCYILPISLHMAPELMKSRWYGETFWTWICFCMYCPITDITR